MVLLQNHTELKPWLKLKHKSWISSSRVPKVRLQTERDCSPNNAYLEDKLDVGLSD